MAGVVGRGHFRCPPSPECIDPSGVPSGCQRNVNVRNPSPASVIAIGDNRRMRPFSFIADASDIADGRDLAERARRAESLGVTTFAIPDHLVAGLYSPGPVPGDGRRGDDDAPDLGLRPQQRPAPPGDPRPGPRHARRPVRRPARRRPRRRLEQARVRRDRPSVRPGRDAGGAADRGGGRHQGLLRRGAVLVPRRALRHHRLRRLPEAGPAAAPAVLHRRRRPPDAHARRPRGGHRRPRAAHPRGAAGRPDEHHLGGDRGEDRLGPRGRRRPLRRPRVQRLPVGLADRRDRRPPGRGAQGHRPPQEPDAGSSCPSRT